MSKPKPKTVRSVVHFRCPFCGLEASAGFGSNGRPVVVHKMPMCERFEAMDPIDFLTAARIHGSN